MTAPEQAADPVRAGARRTAVLALALIALCHAPSVGFGFLAWDDGLHVTANPLVLAPEQASLRQHLTTPGLGYPIPITVATYRLEAALWGVAQAWPFHLTNVLIHLACAALVLAVARRLGLGAIGAVTAALVYGLHPVVAEPVSWVSGRKDLLAGLFGLAMVLFALPPRARFARAASVACYALALLSKPSAAALGAVVPAIELLFSSESAGGDTRREPLAPRLRRALLAGLPYLAVLLPVVWLGIEGQRAVGAIASGEREGASWLRSVGYGLGHHAALLLLWEEPTAKYLPSPWPPGFVPRIDLAAPALALAVALALRKLEGRARAAALLAVLWAALGYLPSSGVIPLSRQFADSYVYLSLIGFAWLLGLGADALARRAQALGRRGVAAWPFAFGVVLAMMLLPSAARFHDDEALWAHARARFPHSARVCRQWANGVATVRGPQAGLAATDECIAQHGDALFVKNRGVLLALVGRAAEARAWLERAQADSPDDPAIARHLERLGAAPAPARR